MSLQNIKTQLMNSTALTSAFDEFTQFDKRGIAESINVNFKNGSSPAVAAAVRLAMSAQPDLNVLGAANANAPKGKAENSGAGADKPATGAHMNHDLKTQHAQLAPKHDFSPPRI